MSKTRIKICGITSAADALTAVELGVDALGFVFANSPRQVNQDTVKSIIKLIPSIVETVGVFVNEKPETIRETVTYSGLHAAQLHGDETPSYVLTLGLPAIKAFRISNKSDLERIKQYELTHFLLDTYAENKIGGTGKTFDWDIAKAAKTLGKIILGGGLNPTNISDALEKVHPYAVDVSSGVEKSPGVKDYQKLEDFIRKVRTWDNRTN